MAKPPAPIYQIKVTLDHCRPPIWRRIQVPGNTRLDKLHDVLQSVMGWTDSHLHQFMIDGQSYGQADDDEWGELQLLPERDYPLSRVVPSAGLRFDYEYDFGDSWHHTLRVEKILPPEPGVQYPRCLAGKRAGPPEDVGGVWGYQAFLEALADPQDEQHAEYMEWSGGEFDAEAFDLEEVNARLRGAQRRRRPAGAAATLAASAENRLGLQLAKQMAAGLAALSAEERAVAENLPLRRDMLTVLTYLRDNKVTGTQSTGNLPLKAVREICARLVVPPALEQQIGERVFRVRSETEVPPLFFLHTLAVEAGWVIGGPARRWRLTATGEQVLTVDAPQQVWVMLATWWTQLDWAFNLPFVPSGFLAEAVAEDTLAQLRALPVNHLVAFEPFAGQLIESAGLHWPIPDQANAGIILRAIVEHAILDPLRELGVLEVLYAPTPSQGADRHELTAVRVTPFGRALLEILSQALMLPA
jgi:hypothetical protein